MSDLILSASGVRKRFDGRDILKGVVKQGTGTAAQINGVEVAGKTGTAEIGRGATKRKNTWIIAFAPFENPTVALAMIVERGESGGKTVAPRVHNVLAAIFGETEITGRTRMRAGIEGRD